MLQPRLIALTLCALAATCAKPPAPVPSADPPAVTLYEGLPHQEWEGELLEKELATKKTIRFSGFPFYDERITPSAQDAQRLRELMDAASTFEAYGGPKKCGGYHPDWAVEIGSGAGAKRALLCFGCEEAKVTVDGRETLYDVEKKAEAAFRPTLGAYARNRPKSPESK